MSQSDTYPHGGFSDQVVTRIVALSASVVTVRPLPSQGVSLMCALVAGCVAILTQIASRRPAFHPSLLLNVADTDALAPHIAALDPSFQFTVASDHYDGVYFWAMAQDPFAQGQAHELIDLAAYRYGHPLYSWIAGTISLGNASWLPVVFWLLSVLSFAGAAWAVSRYVSHMWGSPWWGLLVACSPGLLFSASTVLTEPFQVLVVFALLLQWRKKDPHYWLLASLSVAVCLTKEQLVLVPVALGVSILAPLLRGKRESWARLGALAAGPVCLGLWLAYISTRFTDEQKYYDSGNIGIPFVGWLETFDLAGALRVGDFNSSQIGSTTVPGLMAVAAVILAGSVIGLVRRDALGWIVVLQGALISALGWRTLLYPHEMFRIPSVALLFACTLIVVQLSRHSKSAHGPTSTSDRRIG